MEVPLLAKVIEKLPVFLSLGLLCALVKDFVSRFHYILFQPRFESCFINDRISMSPEWQLYQIASRFHIPHTPARVECAFS